MKSLRIWVVGVAVALGLGTLLAVATPSAGLLFTLYPGSIAKEVHSNVEVKLPAPVNGESDWEVHFNTSGPANFIFQDLTIAPGGYTGWHTHPGVLLTTVVSGSIEWYDGQCRKHVYNAGDSLTESDALHYARNVGADNARLMINFIIAKDQPRKIDQAAPPCALALGLI